MTFMRRAVMSTAVFLLALATGHVMQYGSAIAARLGMSESELAQLTPAQTLNQIEDTHSSPTLPTERASANPSTPSYPRSTTRSVRRLSNTLADQNAISDLGETCDVMFTALAAQGGMAELSLSAPCYANAAVTVQHGALRGTYRLPQTGQLQIAWPVMEPDAEFNARFEDGVSLSASVAVPAADSFAHAAVMWRGPENVALHAFEFGADEATRGHVHAGRAYAASRATNLGRGFLADLGDGTGWRAQVYAFPARAAAETGSVALQVRAAADALTCDGQVLLQTLVSPGVLDDHDRQAVTLQMPDCSATDDVLVLKNLLPPLKVAAN